VSNATLFFSGLTLTGFHMAKWYATLTPEEKRHIADNFSKYLKGDLATHTFKEYHFKDIKEALKLNTTRATEGKILLRP
jgi:trans-2-enoyl-CoA reductase